MVAAAAHRATKNHLKPPASPNFVTSHRVTDYLWKGAAEGLAA